MRPKLNIEIAPLQKLACNCRLCHREISAERQMPINTIIIEGYGMCPNCCQHVSREIENAYWYRFKWLRRVEAISRKKGWGREYRAGSGFRKAP
jgi:hypothetical protein